jgi:hypothetical protein
MRDLSKLYRDFLSGTADILDCFTHANNGHYGAYAQEMCVIKLYDTWERFCRELVLLSAYAEPLSVNGNRVPRIAGIYTRNDAISLVQTIRQYRNLPFHRVSWGDPTASISIAQHLGVHNFQNISLALGVTPSPTEDLRHVRHFLAHRNEHTARNVHQVATNNGLYPTHNVLSILTSLRPPGVSLFELWVIQLRAIARDAVHY